MLKKVLACALVIAAVLTTGAALAGQAWNTDGVVYQAGDVPTTDAEQAAGKPIFLITMEDGGMIRGELYPDIAPQAVGNFIALANSGYYDGLIFHRVIPGFMIQGGCPQGTGTGGPGWKIKGEFSANGVANDLAHTIGVISMARSSAHDSAGSQFFIMAADYPHLDTQYAAFGKTLEGLAVVNQIVSAQRDGRDKPYADQTIQTIRVETFGVEYAFDKL